MDNYFCFFSLQEVLKEEFVQSMTETHLKTFSTADVAIPW